LLHCFFQGNAVSNDNDFRKQFGIIVGRTGTGKTTTVQKLCNKYPEGVLYYELLVPAAFYYKGKHFTMHLTEFDSYSLQGIHYCLKHLYLVS